MGFMEKIFGTHSERELKLINKTIDKIESLRPEMQKLSDEELRGKTTEFKKRLADGETLDDILPEAYAVVREAGKRVLGMEHYRVQLIGGVILHQGRIAEMKTGEGKTLVSTLPAYLNALEGKGVHVVTVNDYLANRDAEWMGQIHRFLGLSVGCVLNSMKSDERREAYNCDITYITNNELGFDYLRDNMVIYKEQLVQRGLHYAIIDEVDSVLIDEARTPLIISGQSGKSTKLYEVCDHLARVLKRGEASKELSKMDLIMGEEVEESGDFIVNEKDKIVTLTADGIKRVEQYFNIENLADPENLEIQHNMELALRAHNLMHRDQDYVVKEDKVLIVDEFTGRIMPGRRYSDGLHQAIEAKEHVKVKRESKTLATITFQNFFNKYTKKAGMTGTALTEEREFRDIYGMDVIEIPTNRPVVRKDLNDAVYATKNEKYRAVIREIEAAHAKGQPVLVGTITIETSELISALLKKKGIQHEVLNAKFHEREAEIVALAGIHGAVTIATNMAGRGTDIKLDPEAKAAGGLKIIGTERHESRRIDNQLRGRAGRQGDPGESRFFLSAEDDLLRLFAGDRFYNTLDAFKSIGDMPVEARLFTSTIENAQKKVESNNFAVRRNVLKYDDVMNKQREVIYGQRNKVLDGQDISTTIQKMIVDTISESADFYCPASNSVSDWNFKGLTTKYNWLITEDEIKDFTKTEDVAEVLLDKAQKLYDERKAEFGEELIKEIERSALLRNVDMRWMDHIDAMDQLKRGISLRAYAQKDPVIAFREESFDMFDEMTNEIREGTVDFVLKVRIRKEEPVERKQTVKITATSADDQTVKKQPVKKAQKVGRNDPCPCGSGKKYKKCCGMNEN